MLSTLELAEAFMAEAQYRTEAAADTALFDFHLSHLGFLGGRSRVGKIFKVNTQDVLVFL